MTDDNILFYVNITYSNDTDVWFNQLKLIHLNDIVEAYNQGNNKCWTGACEWDLSDIKKIRIYSYEKTGLYGIYDLTGLHKTSPFLSHYRPDFSLFYQFKDVTEEFIIGRFGHTKNTTIELEKEQSIIKSSTGEKSKKVFIVHGHDVELKETVARTVEKLGLKAIILHEQPNAGQTIIEKIETYSDVSYAIILYTPCDEGHAINEDVLHKRARQNVVFEHGYLIGKLGRKNVSAIVKDCIELPGDISGVVYINYNGDWKLELTKNMKAANLEIDINKLYE